MREIRLGIMFMGKEQLSDFSFLSIVEENLEELQSFEALDDLISEFAKKSEKSVYLISIIFLAIP